MSVLLLAGLAAAAAAVAVVVVAAAFSRGERARRGDRAPALSSIGEGLARVRPRGGRVLVVFLGTDAASAALDVALARDPALRAATRGDAALVTVHAAAVGLDVAQALLAKYGGAEPAPALPVALVLDADGHCLAARALASPLPADPLADLIRKLSP